MKDYQCRELLERMLQDNRCHITDEDMNECGLTSEDIEKLQSGTHYYCICYNSDLATMKSAEEALKIVIGDWSQMDFSLKRHNDRYDLDVMMTREQYEAVCAIGETLHGVRRSVCN